MINLAILIMSLLLGSTVHCACSGHVSEHTRMNYSSEIQTAFALQADGLSTTAMASFEQGCMNAINAGESPNKIEAIRKLFVWYRTYGYYLRIIKKDPKIFGQYTGSGNYSSLYTPRVSLNYGTDPERDGKAREFILGVSEILTGMFCIWVAPPPYKAIGPWIIYSGFDRAFNAANAAWVQKDISILELQKTGEQLKSAGM